jgi:hypothetical protein
MHQLSGGMKYKDVIAHATTPDDPESAPGDQGGASHRVPVSRERTLLRGAVAMLTSPKDVDPLLAPLARYVQPLAAVATLDCAPRPEGNPMTQTPIAIALPTFFHISGVEQEYNEPTMIPLSRGDGLLWTDGRRLRVVDRWISYDHHGRFGEGLHLFLEPVEEFGEDDRLGKLAPDYFGG